MKSKIDSFKDSIRNKEVAVLGIGISNTPLIKYLASAGVKVTAFDKADEEKLQPIINEFKGLNVKYSLGEDYLKNLIGFDVIFRTPGMRFDLPELIRAREAGAEITSEMEVFFDLCPAEIFAVTGSDGKTTTTTLIYKMLQQQGYKCWLGGNIGIPLLSKIDEIKSDDKVVLELSSFQLHTMKKSPKVAVITNLSPNHLDVHKSMEEYVDAKKNIFKYQLSTGKLVLNYDNEITKSFASEANCEVEFFSRINTIQEGAMMNGSMLVYRKNGSEKEIVSADDIIIPGVHNIENYLTAISAVIEYVDIDNIKKVARTFTGVEHRIELVRELNGVRFYNDSIASSPSRTIAGLKSFKEKVILLSGGKDKKIPYDSLGDVIIDKVKKLYLIGQTGPVIEKSVRDAMSRLKAENSIPIIYCSTYEELVNKAYEGAKEGDVIILSPASTSFDMFKNFEERGNTFKKIVNSL